MPSKRERITFPSKSCPPWDRSVASLGRTTRKREWGCCSEHAPADGSWEEGDHVQGRAVWSIQSTRSGEQNAQRGWWDPEEPPHPPQPVSVQRREAEKATGPGWEEARSGATTPDQALFLGSAVTPNTLSPLHVNLQILCVCLSISSSNCCFLTCIHISQEAGQVVFQNFPQFIVIHTVKSFGIVNKADKGFSGTLLLFQ